MAKTTEADPKVNVEADGLVDMRVSLSFDEDLKIRVKPELAERMLEGEFDGNDVEELMSAAGLDFAAELTNLRVNVESVYEGSPPRVAKPSKPTKSSLSSW